MINRSQIIDLIKAECTKRNLDYKLICAIIETESSFNTFAMRFEPACTHVNSASQYAILNHISEDTESFAQRCSFGLGQTMGWVARGYGYRDQISALCEPENGVYWTCEIFERNGKKYTLVAEKVAAYNAGSAVYLADKKTMKNQDYVDKVLHFYAHALL